MAEDRPTRLSRQLTQKIRRSHPDLSIPIRSDNEAVLIRTRFREGEDFAWDLQVPMADGRTLKFTSKAPASDLLKAKIAVVPDGKDAFVVKVAIGR